MTLIVFLAVIGPVFYIKVTLYVNTLASTMPYFLCYRFTQKDSQIQPIIHKQDEESETTDGEKTSVFTTVSASSKPSEASKRPTYKIPTNRVGTRKVPIHYISLG
jgi:hypothetical protein